MNLEQAQNPQYFVEMEDCEARDDDTNKDRMSVNTNTNNNINKEKANENTTKNSQDIESPKKTVNDKKDNVNPNSEDEEKIAMSSTTNY
ncbi:MADS-box transcription factor [Reticulomyxa filosa]|uniref:MADS-box transcription factor n=1 Tax=Reticulomyxa filosa TaxID=46433 RepID=X6LRN4_RETFI|nr:MADS-box transcription factor [Reticulomyxa filosa]|eukprot:ETO03370.1 MADS-box transcription factor [Reticulomyxa filosa]